MYVICEIYVIKICVYDTTKIKIQSNKVKKHKMLLNSVSHRNSFNEAKNLHTVCWCHYCNWCIDYLMFSLVLINVQLCFCWTNQNQRLFRFSSMFFSFSCVPLPLSLSHLRLSIWMPTIESIAKTNSNNDQKQTTLVTMRQSETLFGCVTIPNIQCERQRHDKIKYICQKCVRDLKISVVNTICPEHHSWWLSWHLHTFVSCVLGYLFRLIGLVNIHQAYYLSFANGKQ